MRRLSALVLLLAPAVALADDPADLITGVERQTVFAGRTAGTVWFHPRGCTLPDQSQLFTLQSIYGSDAFGPVHWTTTADGGKTWAEPRPLAGLGRIKTADGLIRGVCDVVPEYHAKTNTVLAVGHEVFYKDDGKFFREQPPRKPMYAVRSADGTWGDGKVLAWDDPRGAYIYTCNCAQRVTLPDGDVLIPLSFGPTVKAVRSVAVARCGFDGKELTIKSVGNELKAKVGRGYLEPSLAWVNGKFYLTIRAEDGHGYVSTSDDGAKWTEPKAWAWDDGGDVTMSTTQQRWLPHSDGLYLVYTRKAAENAKVFRWRTPLYAAKVDRDTLRLVKATERVVLPLSGADPEKEPAKVAQLGNFHTQAVSPTESWVTVGEVITANWRGDTLLARVKWAKPNTIAPRP